MGPRQRALLAERTPTRNAFQADKTRRRILEACGRLFSRRGFANTTVREIGREAQLTDAAIYYHFKGKHDLLDALVNSELEIDATFEESVPDRTLSVPELMESIIDCSLRLIESHGDILRIVLKEGLAGEPAAARRYREVIDSWERNVAEAITRSGLRDYLLGTDPQTLAREIVYTVAMGVEDTLLFRRDRCASPHKRALELRAFLIRQLSGHFPSACGVTQ